MRLGLLLCARASARRTGFPVVAAMGLAMLCLLLAVTPGCSTDDAGSAQLETARASYQEIRARAANLEQFFQQMEKMLWQKQDDELVEASTGLVEEEGRAYDAFLRSARDAVATCEELKSRGGKYAEYADRLQALLDANQAEALLLKEAMLQVREFVQPALPDGTQEIVTFTNRQNELSGRILASRDSIREMELESEEFYLANLAP